MSLLEDLSGLLQPRPPSLPSGDEAGPTADDQARLLFVRSRLSARSSLEGLIGIQARASAYSRPSTAERDWVRLSEVGLEGDCPGLVEETEGSGPTDSPPRLVETLERRWWAVVRRLGEGSGTGVILAAFETRSQAEAATEDLETCAHELRLGLAFLRSTADREALVRLAEALSDPGEGNQTLGTMAETLCGGTRSDGVRVYVVRLERGRPRLERVYRSPRFGEANDPAVLGERIRHEISPDLGLTDWVTRHNASLLVPHPVEPQQVGRIAEEAVTPACERVRIVAHAESPEDPVGDRETGMCLAPLRIDGASAGALTVFRTEGSTYCAASDVPALAHYASTLAAGARWRISRETSRDKAEEISGLGRLLTGRASLGQVFDAVAAGIGRLARAARCLVFLWDAKAGAYYCEGRWTSDALHPDPDHEPPLEMLRPLRGPLTADAFVSALGPGSPLLRAGGGTLVPRRPLELTSTRTPGMVLVLDEPRLPHERGIRSYDDDLCHQASAAYLGQVQPLVENYVVSLSQAAIQEFGRRTGDAPNGSREDEDWILTCAASVLKEFLGCDAVLVYGDTPKGLVVRASSPSVGKVHGFEIKPGSLTAEIVETREASRILDVDDPESPDARRLDRTVLQDLTSSLGWSGVRSWICWPVVSGDRCVGLLKLLTAGGARFLGPTAMEIVRALAERAGWELQQITRGLVLGSVNALASRLAGLDGDALSHEMSRGIQDLLARFLQRGSEVLITATIMSRRPRAFAMSAGLDPKLINDLETLSEENRETFSDRLGRHHAYAAKILLPGSASIRGHLIALTGRAVSPGQRFVANEAAREVSILLDRERRRHEWKRQVGIFRHALLGPVQGLLSAARLLHSRAVDLGGEEEELKRLKSRIEAEAQAVRSWRVNQKLFFSDRVEIRPQRRALLPFLRAAKERYEEVLAARNLTIELDWQVTESLQFSYDEAALDIAIANLIDNAAKYAFYNRAVTLGASADRSSVRIWVEDEGHGIPASMDARIYEMGVRSEGIDPLRAIDGTGLGLAMVRRIVEAHGGTISHSSLPLGLDRSDPSHPQAHCVRFLIQLPREH